MENKPDYLFTVFKNNDLVTLLNSLQIMTKIVAKMLMANFRKRRKNQF